MIGRLGTRAIVCALTAFAGTTALFAGRSPDPAVAQPSRAAHQAATARAAIDRADEALAHLDAALQSALVDARAGAGLVLSGDEPPDPRFDAAATTIEAAQDLAASTSDALREAEAIGSAVVPPLGVPDAPMTGGELLALAGQLRAAGTTAGAVAALRHASSEVLEQLEAALAGAASGEAAEIDAGVAAARIAMPAVERWNESLPTLPVWTGAVDGLLDALDGLAAAYRSGVEAEVTAALAAYHAAASEADRADRGLAIALGDAAGSIGGGAPAALADALARVAAVRSALASVVLDDAAEGAE